MKIPLTQTEQAICKTIADAASSLGYEAYIIGGFVRDKLLCRATKDIDIVTTHNGITLAYEVAKSCNPTPQITIFKTYGTAQLKLPDIELEFVGARKESYTPETRNPTVTQGTITDDQNRRDFTINALAISLNKANYGALIDPFSGIADLKNKILRTPLLPEITFSDDPLRMLRAIRFATQLQFSIDPNTYNAIFTQAHRISIITQERITEELNKIMACAKPSIGFNLLYHTGLLAIILPEMVALSGTQSIDNKGHKDNFIHTLQVVDNICQVSNNLWLRWAALLHDIGKPRSKRFEVGRGWTFHGHEVVGAKMVPKIFTNLRQPLTEKMRYVQQLVSLHHRPISVTKENITDSAIRRLLFDAGEYYDDLMLLCNADITSKNQVKVARYLSNFELVKQRCVELEEKDHIRNWQPPITGEEIMKLLNIPPSKPIGIIKAAIKDAILDGDIENTYEAAILLMYKLAETLQLSKH